MMIVSIFPSMALSTDKRNAGIRCFSEKEFKGRKELFYLTMHSTCFIYGYMASDIW